MTISPQSIRESMDLSNTLSRAIVRREPWHGNANEIAIQAIVIYSCGRVSRDGTFAIVTQSATRVDGIPLEFRQSLGERHD